MKITDCTLRTRNIVAGVIFCILFAVLWTFLAQPIDVTAKANPEQILETGETKADDTMQNVSLVFPEGKSTFDLNGKDLQVATISGTGADVTICGNGTLTVGNVIRMPDSTLQVKLAENGALFTNGIYMKGGTLLLESGSIHLNGNYTHAETIRISGGEITADTKADGLRTDGSFQMTGGTLSAHGRTHGLHAEGDVNVTGGVLTLSGGNGGFYYAHPDRVHIYEGAPVSAGSGADSASMMETLAGADGRTYVQIGDAKSAKSAQATIAASKETKTATTAAASTTAATEEATKETKNATAAASASTEASTEAKNATATAASTASTSSATATAASTASTSSATEATSAGAEKSLPLEGEVSAKQTEEVSAEASDAASASTTTPSTALPVSAAGSAGAASSSSAASGATSFTAPATADNGTMRTGIILLVLAIAALVILANIPDED